VNQLFCEIQLVVIRSLQAVQHIIINDKQSFELYGFDVLIDSDLKAWLIEINAAPSLTANTEDDYNLKVA
jgi:tubulin polyglutamylase TTLL9